MLKALKKYLDKARPASVFYPGTHNREEVTVGSQGFQLNHQNV